MQASKLPDTDTTYLPVSVESRQGCVQHALPDLSMAVIEGFGDKELEEGGDLGAVEVLGELVQGQRDPTPAGKQHKRTAWFRTPKHHREKVRPSHFSQGWKPIA